MCLVKKSTERSIPKVAHHQEEQPFELTFMDTIGPISPTSIGGFSHLDMFACQVTELKPVCFSKSRSEAAQSLGPVIEGPDIPCDRKIQQVRSDYGGEYIWHDVECYREDLVIRHQSSSAYTPSQRGQYKRDGRAIIAVARCLLDKAKAPHFLWSGLAAIALYLLNRVPKNTIGTDPPASPLPREISKPSWLTVIE